MEGQRERETQNPKQAPHHQRRAQCGARTHKTMRSWPELKPRVRCLTNWATQAPLTISYYYSVTMCYRILKVFLNIIDSCQVRGLLPQLYPKKLWFYQFIYWLLWRTQVSIRVSKFASVAKGTLAKSISFSGVYLMAIQNRATRASPCHPLTEGQFNQATYAAELLLGLGKALSVIHCRS